MVELAPAEAILDNHRNNGMRNGLIPVLRELQEQYHFLPREVLELAAERIEMPLTRVLRVATFYKSFTLRPRGEHTVCVCTGTACHVRGAAAVLRQLERSLGVEAGGTTEDLRFTLERVNCVGACALGPVVVVDEHYHPQMSPSKVSRLIKRYTA